MAKQKRGSVLVFSVVLLLLIFALGTAFLMHVRQASRASANSLASNKGDLVAESALNFAKLHIRSAVSSYRFITPDGVFDGSRTPSWLSTLSGPDQVANKPFLYLDSDRIPSSIHRFFTTSIAWGGTEFALPEDHAWLWWNEEQDFHELGKADPTMRSAEGLSDPIRFTDAKIAIFSRPNGEYRQFREDDSSYKNFPRHVGLARKFVCSIPAGGDPLKSAKEFYQVKYALPEPNHVDDISNDLQGEFYVWIADLDACLYSMPSAWGLDGTTPWGNDDQQIASGVIKELAGYSMTTAPYMYPGMKKIDAPDILKLWTRNPAAKYSSHGDIWLHLGITPMSGFEYFDHRYGLDRYFNIYLDEVVNPAIPGKPTSVKSHPAALNVNTANFETIAAVLSRVPLVDGYDPADDDDNVAKASALAARICAKRPFLCRVDFEDFLAAHLDLNPADGPDAINDVTKPVGMIWYAIPKRADHAAFGYSMPDLVDITEIPGIANVHPMGAILRDVNEQRTRFEFFRADDAVAPLFTNATENALLTVKAFNDLLNAVSGPKRDGTYGLSYYSYDPVKEPIEASGKPVPKFEHFVLTDADVTAGVKQYDLTAPRGAPGALEVWRCVAPSTNGGYYEMTFGSDDTQEVAVGQTAGVFPDPPEPVINAGTDGLLQSPDLNDDDPSSGTDITSGSDYICDSWIHGPLRAYRLPNDDIAQAPTATISSGPGGDGDVSWAPRFAFRSRFFAVYILARPLDVKGNPIRGGERRLEVYYDALKDQVLWRRQPATLKRALGDPQLP